MKLEWGACARPLPGQEECGDAWMVEPRAAGCLVAAVDGLGHGHDARTAAEAALACLRERACPDLEALLREAHLALARTRGAALSLAWLAPEGRLSWTGVGNVEGLVLRQGADPREGGERLLLHGGIVGSQPFSARVASLPFGPGDSLVFASDGLRPEFTRHVPLGLPAQLACERLVERFASGKDDALALAVRRIA